MKCAKGGKQHLSVLCHTNFQAHSEPKISKLYFSIKEASTGKIVTVNWQNKKISNITLPFQVMLFNTSNNTSWGFNHKEIPHHLLVPGFTSDYTYPLLFSPERQNTLTMIAPIFKNSCTYYNTSEWLSLGLDFLFHFHRLFDVDWSLNSDSYLTPSLSGLQHNVLLHTWATNGLKHITFYQILILLSFPLADSFLSF